MKPAGKAIATIYVKTSLHECWSAAVVLATRTDEGLVEAGRMIKLGGPVMTETNLVMGQLTPGAYEVVAIECTNAGTRERFLASTPKTGFMKTTYTKSLVGFSVAPDEIVNLGGVEVGMVGPGQAAARPIPIPPDRLAAWRTAYPDWSKKMVDRPLIVRNPSAFDTSATAAAIRMLTGKPKAGAAAVKPK